MLKKIILSSLFTAGMALGLSIPASAQNIAVVDGTPVRLKQLDFFLSKMPADKARDPAVRENVKQALIARQLFANEAQKKRLLADPEVQMQIEEAKMAILFSKLLEEYATKNVSDEKLKQIYLQQTGGGREFLSKHILVKTEDEAKQILSSLAAGANFETIAKEKSMDKGSGANGGELGWSASSSYVPEFAQALEKMQKNQLLKQAVKTQFGYHIIKVEDVREKAMPPIKKLRADFLEALTQNPELQNQLTQQMQEDLRKKAKIQ